MCWLDRPADPGWAGVESLEQPLSFQAVGPGRCADCELLRPFVVGYLKRLSNGEEKNAPVFLAAVHQHLRHDALPSGDPLRTDDSRAHDIVLATAALRGSEGLQTAAYSEILKLVVRSVGETDRRIRGWVHRCPTINVLEAARWITTLIIFTAPAVQHVVDSGGKLYTRDPVVQLKLRAARMVRCSLWAYDGSRELLEEFLSRAIRGSAIGARAISTGLFFEWFTEETGVRFETVLGWRCSVCDEFAQSQRCQNPSCDRLFDQTVDRREGRDYFFLPYPYGAYLEITAWHCQTCRNFFHESLPRCPLRECGCRRTAGAARSHVWSRIDLRPEEIVTTSSLPPVECLEDVILTPQHEDVWRLVSVARWTVRHVAEHLERPVGEVHKLLKEVFQKVRDQIERVHPLPDVERFIRNRRRKRDSE